VVELRVLVGAVWPELVDELGSSLDAERGRHPDVAQPALVVVEPEQEGPDPLAVLVPAEPADHHVGGPLVLDLQQRALPGV
jgi:hypothetical protein